MIRVIIEREIAEGLEQFYEKAIADLLEVIVSAPGYLSGESLVDIRRPNRRVVLTRWSNEDAWNRWFHSPQRQLLLTAIAPFMLQDEKVTLLRQPRFREDPSAQ